ncbi:MAG: sigma-54-dependent Fis family transcriptional regulator [Acidobacteria bacterium]|nr:sigma-54-dependent Fis family transcriptional regulator [Acidobacteriota bacterium]
MSKTKIVVVDDDPTMREVLGTRLENWNFRVSLAYSGAQARELILKGEPDIVISDIVMPGLSGLELLRILKDRHPGCRVILITAHATVDMAVEAMKVGAQDFITKPLDYDKLKAVLDATQEEIRVRRESAQLVSRLKGSSSIGALVGNSAVMREIYSLIPVLAGNDASVLISGESGTGKEVVARTIHKLSRRAENPFIAINSAAIPSELMESEIFGHEKGSFTGAIALRAGCFELANQGVLLLDEIAEMPAALQPKLLRVLEDGCVRRLGGHQEFVFNVRVLASTNRDPGAAVKDGQLREDLYYRLNVFSVKLPPLRDRREDVPLLAQHFMEEFNRKHETQVEGFRPEVLEKLKGYSWPGNVRELKNVVERAVILARSKWVELSHLPPYLSKPAESSRRGIVLPPGITVAEAEKELILTTLERTGKNKAEAARRLGLDVKTIRNKLKSYGIDE